MPDTTLQAATPAPLTTLTEDEILFRDNIRQFADEKIRPLVKEMDEKGIFDKELIHDFFQLGLMGIEIPEQYGGGGAKFFEAILAVEELSRVDASSGVIVDVQNTLVNNALLRWGNEEQKKRYLPRMASETVGAYALSEAGSGSDAFALQTRAALKGSEYLLSGRKLWITNAKEAGLFVLFATIDPAAGYKGITAFLVEKDFPGFTVGKKEDKLGIRASSTCELILEDCRVPKENVLGEPGKGYKIAIETLERRPHRHRRADDWRGPRRLGIRLQVRGERKQFGKAIAEFPRHPVPDRADGHRDRGRPPDGLQRRAHEGRGRELREGSGHDQAVRLAGGRARDLTGHRNLRRLRLHQGLSRREILARRQDRQDLRRHVQHATGNHRQARVGEIDSPHPAISLWGEADFNDLARFSAGGEFPLRDCVFRSLEQDRAAALRFNGLHAPVRRHDCNHLDGAPQVHLSCELGVAGSHFSHNLACAFGGSLLTLGRCRRSEAECAEKKQSQNVPRLHYGDP